MIDPVDVGIVGTSWWADSMHLPALAHHPHAKIDAICGRDVNKAKHMAERWHIPYVYADYHDMIEDRRLDAVVISTSNDAHYPIAMEAMQAGLHVLCEKPLAMTYAQAKEMADFATAHHLKTLVPFTYGFMPTSRFLKELIDDGYIGHPYHLNMRYYTGYARNGEYQWRFDLGKAGAGVVGDLGTHFFYIAQMLYGDVKSVSCHLTHLVERVSTDSEGKPYQVGDDGAIVTLQFENGASGVIQVSAVCYEDTPFGQTHHMEFHGSGGTLYSYTDWATIQTVSGARVGEGQVKPLEIPERIWAGARRDTVHNTYRDIFRQQDNMTRGFITAIFENKQPMPDFQVGAKIQRILAAAIKSNQEGRWIEVNSVTT
ncbi:MAG: Gfo/Idh/MocA family oxidoreductase [Anaerolineae bacterium]|nr:Gfo/Idh/MocA family oxidoreductase [Anaerolineae bacterium]